MWERLDEAKSGRGLSCGTCQSLHVLLRAPVSNIGKERVQKFPARFGAMAKGIPSWVGDTQPGRLGP